MALDAEYLRMQNEWFFKWHHIGGFWSTIQRYARQKVGQLFDQLEVELQKYPLEIRSNALSEAQSLIPVFIEKIRKAAVDKDRILRGNGFTFPPRQDLGNWAGAQPFDIKTRIATLRHIYCDLEVAKGGDGMTFRDMMRDKVTLVKANGKVARENIQAQVSAGQIITFDADLPLEPGDHFLRSLPSGLVEDYVVDDPNFMTGIHGIPSSFQSKVHRSRQAAAPSQQVIQQITNHFHGDNSRVTFGTDNSVNVVNQLQPLAVANLIEQIKPHVSALPEPQRTQIAARLQLLDDEIKCGSPEPSKLRAALSSILTIVEGAAGNLIAAGIQAMIMKMLS